MTPTPVGTLGIVGAGRLGSVIAQLAASAGFEVLVASRREPALLAGLAAGWGAQATTTGELFARSDAVVLALPLGQVRELPSEALRGKLVLDATNYWWLSDGTHPELDDPRTTTSEMVQRHLDGARVVKALGHMGYQDLEDEARPPGAPQRKAIAIAGDDEVDLALVARIVDAVGFDPVIAGPLDHGIMLEPGAEAFGADVDAERLREMLDGFETSQRGIVVARARGGRLFG